MGQKLKKYRKVKYQKLIISKKEIKLRDKIINYILNLKISSKTKKSNNCDSCKFYAHNLNNKNIILFYKKFNINIQLKEKYDLNSYKKKSNKNACFKSYIIFTDFLIKNKKINSVQKLNTILKINDLLILKFKKNSHASLLKYFKQNLIYEKKLINLYL